jgi:hypothetical protein
VFTIPHLDILNKTPVEPYIVLAGSPPGMEATVGSVRGVVRGVTASLLLVPLIAWFDGLIGGWTAAGLYTCSFAAIATLVEIFRYPGLASSALVTGISLCSFGVWMFGWVPLWVVPSVFCCLALFIAVKRALPDRRASSATEET